MGRTLPTGQAGRNNDQDAKTPRCQIMTKIQETRTLPTGQAGKERPKYKNQISSKRQISKNSKKEHFDREKDRSKSEKKRAVVRI